MMFWKMPEPDRRNEPNFQNAGIKGGKSPRMYLALQGGMRGVLGAFVGSVMFFLFYISLILRKDAFGLFDIQVLFILTCGCSMLSWYSAIPAAAGGMLLGLWLYRDLKQGSQTTKKTLLKGILVGIMSGLAAWAIALFAGRVFIAPYTPISPSYLGAFFIAILPSALAAAGCGGAFAGWMLTKDIKNRHRYGF